MPAPALCVYCGERPVDPRWRPFCSQRCKMADLGRWLSGDYRVPDTPGSTDVDEDDPAGTNGQHSKSRDDGREPS